jgi:hypothetical protein
MPLQRLLEVFGKEFWLKVWDLFVRIGSRAPARLAITLLLLLPGAWFTFLFLQRAYRYEETLYQLFSRELAPTPQSYKGLEAFIMSALPLDVDADLRDCQAGAKFSKAIQQLIADLKGCSALAPAKAGDLRRASEGNGMILTDDASQGFLFLPVSVLRTFTAGDLVNLSKGVQVDHTIARLVTNESNVLQEVAVTKALIPSMEGLLVDAFSTGGPKGLAVDYVQKLPVQVYLVTRNGLNRIFKSGQDQPEAFYARQFLWRTYFPARPYYRAAIESELLPDSYDDLANLQPTDVLGKHFEISPPYSDLAGNGIVITLSRALFLTNGIEMVLCIDLSFVPMVDRMKAKLKEFGAVAAEITVNIGGDVTSSDCPAEALGMFTELKGLLKAKSRGRADALGKVVLLNPAKFKAGEPLEVSVPVSEVNFPSKDTIQTKLLLFRLDLTRYKKTTVLYGAAAAALFVAAAFLVASWLATTLEKNKDFETAMERVGIVMKESPTPYIRLNFEDHIVDVNSAAKALLGITSVPDDECRELTFASFFTDPVSSSLYNQIQSKRMTNQHVEPYPIDLTPKDSPDRKVQIRVVSESIPAVSHGQLPITFGILLSKVNSGVNKD